MFGLRRVFFFFFLVFIPAGMDAQGVISVREGQDALLNCFTAPTVVGDGCNKTTWTFIGKGPSAVTLSQAVELVKMGQLQRQGLGLAGDCSLVIKNVKTQDEGSYMCSQNSGNPEVGTVGIGLYLSVIKDEAGRFLSLVVRNGDNVTLPCFNATTKGNCPRPAWTVNRMSNALNNVTESFRLIVTTNCSLTIIHVEPKDAGVYFCNASSNKENGVQLTVVQLVECRSERFVGLECQVTGPSNQMVRWTGVPDVEGVAQSVSQDLVATVSFAAVHPVYVSREYQAWSCSVEDQIFNLPTPPPGEEPGVASLDVVMVTMHVVEIVLISVVIVFLLRASGNRKWSGGEAGRKRKDGPQNSSDYQNVGIAQ